MIPALLSLLLCAVPAAGGERPLDLVELKDGTKLSGRVVLEDATRIVLRNGTRERILDRAEVATSRSRLAAWKEAMERWRTLDKEDATKIADIATFAARMELVEEARVFALRSIASDPANRVARDILGHERKEKDWVLREDGRRWNWAERVKRSAEFRDGWQLETTHWSLQTNLPLLEATNAILDLENIYTVYFEQFAPEVGAYHVDTPLLARIYADTKSYPELGGSRGFYDREGRVLVVNAALGLDRGLLVHEAIHQLVDETGISRPGARAEIPPWLDEGLSEYFRATTKGEPGRLSFDENGIDTVSMRDSGEYLSTSRQDLKYAQSYTFVHFLMAADRGRYRAKFFDFLRGAWIGQASSTDLEKAMGVKVDVIEKAWTTWVRERAR